MVSCLGVALVYRSRPWGVFTRYPPILFSSFKSSVNYCILILYVIIRVETSCKMCLINWSPAGFNSWPTLVRFMVLFQYSTLKRDKPFRSWYFLCCGNFYYWKLFGESENNGLLFACLLKKLKILLETDRCISQPCEMNNSFFIQATAVSRGMTFA